MKDAWLPGYCTSTCNRGTKRVWTQCEDVDAAVGVADVQWSSCSGGIGTGHPRASCAPDDACRTKYWQ